MEKCRKEMTELQYIVSLVEFRVIQTFEDGRYTNEIIECCIKLLKECSISIRKLTSVIETVRRTNSIKVTQLPSTAFLSRIYCESKIIASKQVAEAMLSGYDPTDHVGFVLHQDAMLQPNIRNISRECK